MTNVGKIAVVSLLICTAVAVLFLDAVAAIGLTFTGFSHYSMALIMLLLVACFIDLPAAVVAFRKPRMGAAMVLAGLGGTLLFIALYFVTIHQLPTIKVSTQALGFLLPKLLLATEMYWLSRYKLRTEMI